MKYQIKNKQPSFCLFITFLTSFFLCAFILPAQNQNIIFQKLTIKNGLAHDYINVVYRDRFGFLWIGTGSALQKYDGYNFITYRTSKSDSTTISKNIVYSIFEDSKGRIWFGTDGGGLNLFDRATSKFSRFDNYINKTVDSWALRISEITEDKNGILWLATFNGLFSFDPDLKKFNRFMPDTTKTESISSNFIHSVSMGDNNRLILTTKNGINIYDQKSKIFYNYMNNPGGLLLFNSMSVTSYFQENDSVSWFGTPDGKLFKYNFINNTITDKTYYFKMKSMSGYEWFSYFKDLSDNLWISSLGNSLVKINLSSEEITRFKNNILETSSISSNNINKMFVDRDSTFWIGTTAGLNYFNLQRQAFNVINYNDVYDNNPSLELASVSHDQRGNYWAATLGNGLYLLDKKYKAIKNFNLGFNKDARFEGDRIITSKSASSKINLIDWELSDFGDPAWDVGCFMQSLLLHWVKEFKADEEKLPAIKEAAVLFMSEYINRMKINKELLKSLIIKIMEFAAIRLIQSSKELAYRQEELQPLQIKILQMCFNILSHPQKAAKDLLGISY